MNTPFTITLCAIGRPLVAASLMALASLVLAVGVPDPVFLDGFELTAVIVSPDDQETRTAGMPLRSLAVRRSPRRWSG